jgi:hypothetical protein
MSAESDTNSILSEPWQIQFLEDDNQAVDDWVVRVSEQAGQLSLNEQNTSTEPKQTRSCYLHEQTTHNALNEAAKRVSAETFKNVCVSHPTQNHTATQGGPNNRPDFTIAWSYDGVRGKTAVVDAKDYHSSFPREKYNKILEYMHETKVIYFVMVCRFALRFDYFGFSLSGNARHSCLQ